MIIIKCQVKCTYNINTRVQYFLGQLKKLYFVIQRWRDAMVDPESRSKPTSCRCAIRAESNPLLILLKVPQLRGLLNQPQTPICYTFSAIGNERPKTTPSVSYACWTIHLAHFSIFNIFSIASVIFPNKFTYYIILLFYMWVFSLSTPK